MPYLLGASSPTTTHTTPSSASALLKSIFLMRAWGSGECRIFPMSMPGRLRSSVYLPAPVVLAAESISATGLPMMEKSGISVCHPNGNELRLLRIPIDNSIARVVGLQVNGFVGEHQKIRHTIFASHVPVT